MPNPTRLAQQTFGLPTAPLAFTNPILTRAVSKTNAQQTKANEGQTAQLPGAGGVMPTTPTMNQTTNLPPGYFPDGGPMVYSSGLDVGRIGAAAGPVCDLLPEPAKSICKGVATVIQQPKPTTGGSSTASTPATTTCPPGSVRVGNTCIAPGDMFPGGAPGVFEAGGQAVMGAFGLPASSPTVVGTIAGRDGMRPILRCGRGMVLGFDNLCYPKAVLPRRSRFRKHRGAPRPPMTGADAAALRRIGTLQKRVKDLASDAGLACSSSPRRKRRK